ncbi:glycosyltransferase [Planctomycetota bacterium]
MINNDNTGELVSILMPTYNRPRYFYNALNSAVRQNYSNLQIIVINDGGTDVGDIVDSFNDGRIEYIDRKENRGKAFSLNEALSRTRGKYVCYLDDDDMYYPEHVQILVDVLENDTDCQVAYTDLYKVCCNINQDGTRQVLSKVVEVSRDFDRFLMLHFNHVLHVSLMHRRDLINKAGLYNEKLDVLIDWDMTRRMSFFTDFHHVHNVTGEYYNPIGDCDRISIQQRKDNNEYGKNVLAIRTARPPKPWLKIDDLSIIFFADKLNKQAGETIRIIWRHTFYPYKLYLPVAESEYRQLETDMPNVEVVPVDPSISRARQVSKILENCEGRYIAIIINGCAVKDMWIENSVYALINGSFEKQGFELECAYDSQWAIVLERDQLQFACDNYCECSLPESMQAAGITLRKPTFDEYPFQFDNLLNKALAAEKQGDFGRAAQICGDIAENHKNELWMKRLQAKIFYESACYTKAAQLCSEINQDTPIVDTLLLEAKIKRREKKFDEAIELLTTAQRILEG